MNFLKVGLYSFFLLAFSSACYATNSSLTAQRTLFKQAQKALGSNQISQFNVLKKKLNNYPLLVYLDYLYLRSRLKQTDSNTIAQFLAQNQNTFYADKLGYAWLKYLAKNAKWALFLEHYQHVHSAYLQCSRLQALIATGDTEQAFVETPTLWLVSRSQHSACDPVFKRWQEKGLLTDELRWQRIQLALQDNQFNLAKHLAKSLDHSVEAHAWIKRWKSIHFKPLVLLKQLPGQAPSNQKVSLMQDVPISRNIIQHGIYRLARKSTDKAFETWQQLEPHYNFSEQDKLTIQRGIANRAALNREDRTLEFYGDIPAEPWRVRAALWQQDWPAVQQAIRSLNSNEQQSSRWQYWLARSQAKLGHQNLAMETYQTLAMDRDFYSFLAADRLQQSYQMNDHPLQFEQVELDKLAQHLSVMMLYEFYTLNMMLQARRQAYRLTLKLSAKELQMLATLTYKWGWHHQTIALLSKAKYWDALDLRFPIAYDTAILKAGKTNGLDPSWLFGIARQESAFNPQAHSPTGARGLMQLMPKTGKLIARLIKKPLKRTSELLNPERNIQLGSAYLRRMYDKNQHNPVLATASYNAGAHRIARWLPKEELAADIWIENIPFNETRKYTRNVISYAAIFDFRRKKTIIRLSQRMPAVKPKTP